MLARALVFATALVFAAASTPAHAEGLFEFFNKGSKTEATPKTAPNDVIPPAEPVAPVKPVAPQAPKVEAPKVESQPSTSFNASPDALKTDIENKVPTKADVKADVKAKLDAKTEAKVDTKTEAQKPAEKAADKKEEIKTEEKKPEDVKADEKKAEEIKAEEAKKAEEVKKEEEAKKEEVKPAAAKSKEEEDPSGMDVSNTLYGLAKKNGATTYAELMTYAKIDMRLKLPGNMTLFAPSDSAFEKLGSSEIASLKKPENIDKLNALLTYHIVNGKMDEKRLKGQVNAPNASQGDVLTIDGTGSDIKVGTGEITRGDIAASNGILHIINTVQIPPKH